MDRYTLLRLYAGGRRHFWDEYLDSVDLSGATLTEIDFYSANLVRVCFRNADLRDARLKGADMTGCDLAFADLRGANLSAADLRNCVLTGIRAWDGDIDLSVLPSVLWQHAKSRLFDQGEWGTGECGTPCCLAGKAAEFVGCPGSSGHGVIAIALAMPEFNLDVLYQSDPATAINELSRFVEV